MKKFLYILPVMVLSFFCIINSAQALVDSTVEINSSTTNGPSLSNGDYYGTSIANIGDLNGDGVKDVAVGAYQDDDGGSNRGAVYIHFLNSDGSIDSTVEINDSTTNGPNLSDSDYYGSSITNIGDLNGDGVQDIAVGATRDDDGGLDRGAVHIHFLNSDGSIKSTVEINSSTTSGPTLTNGDYYGKSITNIGDLNGDGVQDIAVGAVRDDNDGSDRGAVHIHFMNTDGSIDSTVEINSSTTNGPTLDNGDNYGSSIANIGDLNGDGVQDIAVGAYGDDEGGPSRGAIHIHFMNTNGSIKATVEINSSTTNGPILDDTDYYGKSITNIGDLNGDGVQDIAVGADWDDEGGPSRGTIHIHFMNTDGSIKSTVEINSSTTNGPNLSDSDYYGGSITNIGDLDGDGTQDIAVGAYSDDEGGSGRGAVHIHFMSDITPAKTPIYRLYNTKTGTQLYTKGQADRDKILNKWSDFEFTDGTPAFYARTTYDGNTPMYRLYNKRTGAQLYTKGEADRDKILAKWSDFEFTDGAPAFYAAMSLKAGLTPIFRLYNTKTGMHLYTKGEADRDKILNKYKDFEFTDGAPAFYASLSS